MNIYVNRKDCQSIPSLKGLKVNPGDIKNNLLLYRISRKHSCTCIISSNLLYNTQLIIKRFPGTIDLYVINPIFQVPFIMIVHAFIIPV
jgi:hypothetical protein